MHEHKYRIWQWGKPTHRGSNAQYNVAIFTKAKRSLRNRYELANEILCTRLGLALKLPIPVGVAVTFKGDGYYASLHPSVAGDELPDAEEEDLDAIAANEWLACGILVFDSWILNEDRYDYNIAYIEEEGQTYIYDHGRAFYFRDGRPYFESERNSLGIGEHCLRTRITTLRCFDEWHEKILEIPEYFINDSVTIASEFGLPKDDVQFCTDFLLDRRERLRDIFQAHYTSNFPKCGDCLLDPFRPQGEPGLNYQI